jgi:hypothetical protein
MADEPTLADVLAEIRSFKATTVAAFADLKRDMRQQFASHQRTAHLEFRALDGRLAVIEAALDDLRQGFTELLAVAHNHPEGTL